MAFHTGVAEALADYGFKPNVSLVFLDGWQTRGSSTFNPRGSVNHHTAGSATGVLPSLGILVNGREGLPGPLCNGALDRLNRVWLIAAGRANHAGSGGWAGLSGNSSVWGLEVEHVGTTAEPVTPEKWNAMHRFHAAVADYSGFNPLVYTCQHFEWAPTRKIDFVKSITNPDSFRRNVASQTPKEDSLSAEEVKQIIGAIDDTRPFFARDSADPSGAVWIVYKDSGTKRWVQNDEMWVAATYDRVYSNGFDEFGRGVPWVRSKAHLDTIETVGPVPPGWESPDPPP